MVIVVSQLLRYIEDRAFGVVKEMLRKPNSQAEISLDNKKLRTCSQVDKTMQRKVQTLQPRWFIP